jgi:HKD family nuclease
LNNKYEKSIKVLLNSWKVEKLINKRKNQRNKGMEIMIIVSFVLRKRRKMWEMMGLFMDLME